jgi:hypothetical protein
MAEFEFKINAATGEPAWSISLTEILKGLITPKSNDREKEFIDIYSYLKTNRYELANLAMKYYELKNPRVPIQPIKGVNLLGEQSWIPEPAPIDLQVGDSELLKLDFITEQPKKNKLIYRADYLPWGRRYVDNVATLNEKIIKEHRPPKELRPRLFDAPIYELVAFERKNGKFIFKCCRNDYYSYMDNCELLLFEFARAIWRLFIVGRKPLDVEKLKNKNLPFRSQVNVFDFTNRCVGIGINTLFIMKDGEKTTFFKHKRTPGATMEAINTEHVVPAGTFQPRRKLPLIQDPDFNIYTNILRELGEELLGRKEMEQIKTSTDEITKDPHLKNFHQLFVQGYAKIFFLGWGLDPLTTKAEFLTALVVDIKEFNEKFGKPLFKHNWEGGHFAFPFDQQTVKDFAGGAYTLPAGAGCAKLAWDNRDSLLSNDGHQ